jgi:hypothetical protein
VYLIAVLRRFACVVTRGVLSSRPIKAQPRSADAADAEGHPMNARLLLLVLLAASLPALASTQVYSWTDANGVKHFSDSPPPASVNAQKLKVRGSLTSEAPADPAPAPAAPTDADKPAGPPPATVRPIPRSLADSAENRAKQCDTAKKNLAILQGDYPVNGLTGNDGKAQVLDDAARKAAVDRTQEQVTFYCR